MFPGKGTRMVTELPELPSNILQFSSITVFDNHNFSPSPMDREAILEGIYTDIHYQKIMHKDDYPVSGDVDDRPATTKVLLSRCRTDEVEPGRFVRKCETSKKIYQECVGRPTQMIESNIESTEEDITDQMAKLSSSVRSAEAAASSYFAGLRSDTALIDHKFFG